MEHNCHGWQLFKAMLCLQRACWDYLYLWHNISQWLSKLCRFQRFCWSQNKDSKSRMPFHAVWCWDEPNEWPGSLCYLNWFGYEPKRQDSPSPVSHFPSRTQVKINPYPHWHWVVWGRFKATPTLRPGGTNKTCNHSSAQQPAFPVPGVWLRHNFLSVKASSPER